MRVRRRPAARQRRSIGERMGGQGVVWSIQKGLQDALIVVGQAQAL